MIKEINKKGNPVLQQAAVQCVPIIVKAPTGGLTGAVISADEKNEGPPWLPEVVELVTDLLDTAESLGSSCLGLAANQIWDKDTPCPAIFVMRWPAENGEIWRPIINPALKTTGKTLKVEESCLSIPGITMKKSRGKNVVTAFQTIDDHNVQVVKIFHHYGVYAHIAQHEYDHLQGKLIKK